MSQIKQSPIHSSIQSSDSSNVHTRNHNIAYPVNDNFVKVGKFLYPITHSFVVGESWILDPEAPAILECYNIIPPLRPLNTSHMEFSTHYGTVSETFTFACNNLTSAHCIFTGQLSHEYGGNWGIETDLLVIGNLPGNIRTPARIEQFYGGNNQKTTLTYVSQSRDEGFIGGIPRWTRNDAQTLEAGLTGWAWPTIGLQKDVVFWLFDYSFESNEYPTVSFPTISLMPRNSFLPIEDRLFSGNFQEFLQNSPTDPHLAANWEVSNDTFSVGERGIRLISRKYWNAPWLRYPHLM